MLPVVDFLEVDVIVIVFVFPFLLIDLFKLSESGFSELKDFQN